MGSNLKNNSPNADIKYVPFDDFIKELRVEVKKFKGFTPEEKKVASLVKKLLNKHIITSTPDLNAVENFHNELREEIDKLNLTDTVKQNR